MNLIKINFVAIATWW